MSRPDTAIDEDMNDLLRHLQPRMRAYFLRRLSHAEDADDATSETMLVMWRRRHDIPTEPTAAVPYAFGIARLVLKNSQRQARRKFERHVSLDQAATREDPDTTLEHWDVMVALDTLRPVDRELVTLVHWDGLTVAAAGASLGLTPARSYRRHRSALEQLRLVLVPQDEVEAMLLGPDAQAAHK